jgi:hypothetical protein
MQGDNREPVRPAAILDIELMAIPDRQARRLVGPERRVE